MGVFISILLGGLFLGAVASVVIAGIASFVFRSDFGEVFGVVFRASIVFLIICLILGGMLGGF